MMPPVLVDWVKLQAVDAFTGATPLARWKFENVTASAHDLLSGAVTASTGETSAILILLCGMYLAARKFMEWRIPGGGIDHGSVHCMDVPSVRSDALSFAAVRDVVWRAGAGRGFMATDMATSPVTPVGVWIYGAVIGVVTVMIRYFGGLTEGVMYAILLGNALTPFIDRYTQPRVFGTRQQRKK